MRPLASRSRVGLWVLCGLLLLPAQLFGALSADQLQHAQAAVDRVNLYRQLSGLGTVTLDLTLSDGAAAHAAYLNLNPSQIYAGLDAHNEYTDHPGYSAAGAAAGKASDIFYGSIGAAAIDGWYATYYHRNPILSPGVTTVGYGDDPGAAVGFSITVLQFKTFNGPGNVLSPADGSDGNAVAGNGEVPQPVPNFGPNTGNPIIAYFAGSSKVAWTASTITANGQALPHKVVAPNLPANPVYENNEICLITDAPLPAGATVAVQIDYAQSGAKTVSWSFKTSGSGAFDAAAAQASLAAKGGSGGGTPSVDSDGDGFFDEIETAAGTSPSDPASTPFGGQPAGTAQALPAAKLAVKLNFAKTDSDSIALSGTLPVPDGFIPTGQQVIVDVGGAAKAFTLDEHGKSTPAGNDSFKIGKPKSGAARYTAKFNKGRFATALADEGLSNADVKGEARTVTVTVCFNLALYQAAQAQQYSAKSGKSGRTKQP